MDKTKQRGLQAAADYDQNSAFHYLFIYFPFLFKYTTLPADQFSYLYRSIQPHTSSCKVKTRMDSNNYMVRLLLLSLQLLQSKIRPLSLQIIPLYAQESSGKPSQKIRSYYNSKEGHKLLAQHRTGAHV